MGRELKRKQAKKEGKSLVEDNSKKNENPYSDIYKLLKTFGILLVIVIGIHFFTALVITKEIEWFTEWFKKDEEKVPTTVANSILANNTFKQKEEEYYVYFYDYSDEDEEVANIVGTIKDLTVYRVDTGSALNNNYVSEESNKSAKTLEELKVKSSTVIKVSGETITSYYENDEITTNLGK